MVKVLSGGHGLPSGFDDEPDIIKIYGFTYIGDINVDKPCGKWLIVVKVLSGGHGLPSGLFKQQCVVLAAGF